jgi:ATP-binding cassette subfamily F protein uup
VGGYDDWLHQRREAARAAEAAATAERPRAATRAKEERPSTAPRKRSYREEQELLALPARIEALEQEQQTLSAAVAGPDFYKEGAEAIHRTLARLEQLQREVLDAYARWDELDSRGA